MNVKLCIANILDLRIKKKKYKTVHLGNFLSLDLKHLTDEADLVLLGRLFQRQGVEIGILLSKFVPPKSCQFNFPDRLKSPICPAQNLF